MSPDNEHDASPHPHSPHIPDADEPSFPELEEDQTIAPRPEEELADVLRAEPDVEDHSEGSQASTEG